MRTTKTGFNDGFMLTNEIRAFLDAPMILNY